MNLRSTALLSATFVAVFPLLAPAAPYEPELHAVKPEAGCTTVSRSFDSMDKNYVRDGIDREIEDILKLKLGQNLAEIESNIGPAAHKHGDDSYEYHLLLPLQGKQPLLCQYRVFFDGEGKLESAAWRRPQCLDLISTY